MPTEPFAVEILDGPLEPHVVEALIGDAATLAARARGWETEQEIAAFREAYKTGPLRSADLVAVGRTGERIVALCTFRFLRSGAHTVMHLSNAAILPEAQRGGLMTRMVRGALARRPAGTDPCRYLSVITQSPVVYGALAAWGAMHPHADGSPGADPAPAIARFVAGEINPGLPFDAERSLLREECRFFYKQPPRYHDERINALFDGLLRYERGDVLVAVLDLGEAGAGEAPQEIAAAPLRGEVIDRVTAALHARVDAEGALPSTTPLYQAAAFEGGSRWFYSRKDNPNVAELELCVRTLEGARHAVGVSTGMAAVRACLDLLRPGDTVVLNALVYGCSYRLFHRVAEQWGLDLRVLDLSAPGALDAVPERARLVFFETPTNPFLRTVDIAAVAEAARRRAPGAIVVVDNTWASPLFQRPLALGADVSIHSATKYLSGHADVMGGILLTDRDDLDEAFRATRFYSGAVLDPHSAWLLRRSLQTLAIRLAEQSRACVRIRDLLATLPQVARVYYPTIDGRQLTGYGGILFFELREDLVDRYADLVGALHLFGSGTGMAGVTSYVAQPYTGSHASMNDAEKARMGLGRGLVRLSVGLEPVDDLERCVREALARIDQRGA